MTPEETDIALSKAKDAHGLSAFEDSALNAMVWRRKRDGDRFILMNWQRELLERILVRVENVNAA